MGVPVRGMVFAAQKAMQGLSSAPVALVGVGFLFCTKAYANKIGSFSQKPWPCRA